MPEDGEERTYAVSEKRPCREEGARASATARPRCGFRQHEDGLLVELPAKRVVPNPLRVSVASSEPRTAGPADGPCRQPGPRNALQLHPRANSGGSVRCQRPNVCNLVSSCGHGPSVRWSAPPQCPGGRASPARRSVRAPARRAAGRRPESGASIHGGAFGPGGAGCAPSPVRALRGARHALAGASTMPQATMRRPGGSLDPP